MKRIVVVEERSIALRSLGCESFFHAPANRPTHGRVEKQAGGSASLAAKLRADQSLHTLPLLQFVRADRHAVAPPANLRERNGVRRRRLTHAHFDRRSWGDLIGPLITT